MIHSIQVGMPKDPRLEDYPDEVEREWSTGIFNQPVTGRVYLGLENLEGDVQTDRLHHGRGEHATGIFSELNCPTWKKRSLQSPSLRRAWRKPARGFRH